MCVTHPFPIAFPAIKGGPYDARTVCCQSKILRILSVPLACAHGTWSGASHIAIGFWRLTGRRIANVWFPVRQARRWCEWGSMCGLRTPAPAFAWVPERHCDPVTVWLLDPTRDRAHAMVMAYPSHISGSGMISTTSIHAPGICKWGWSFPNSLAAPSCD